LRPLQQLPPFTERQTHALQKIRGEETVSSDPTTVHVPVEKPFHSINNGHMPLRKVGAMAF
jgi:hypothetical protein